jgi:hypothetical protein
MKTRDVLTFSTELSDLLASGMNLGQALTTLASRAPRSPTPWQNIPNLFLPCMSAWSRSGKPAARCRKS